LAKKTAEKGLLKYASLNACSPSHIKTRPEPEFVAFLSTLNERGKLLDVGCGIGFESDYAQKLGFEVTGIDKDYGCIKKAKELNPNPDFRQIDFFNYIKNVPKNEFNVIVDSKFSNKLSLGKLKRYYKNISKALKYGGYMYLQVLSTEDGYCKTHCPKREWTKIGDEYIRYFSKAGLLNLLKLTGLKVESLRTIKQRTFYELHNNETKEETYHIVIARQIIKKW